MTVGKSKVTPFKQKDFYHWCSNYIKKTINVYEKHKNKTWINDSLLFIDASCGDMNPNEEYTSPQIFLESSIAFNKNKNPIDLYFIDRDQNALRSTKRQYLKRYKNKIQNTNINVRFRKRNMQEILQDLSHHKYRYGLLYFDPNGFTLDDYTSIIYFLQGNPRIDVILNLNIGMLKRVVPAGKSIKKGKWLEYEKYNLKRDLFEKLNKKEIWIRDDIKIHHKNIKNSWTWVMLSGTNMPNFNPNLKKEHHFVDIKSIEGQEIINKYNI